MHQAPMFAEPALAHTVCQRCGRRLTHPRSLAIGMGPTCRGDAPSSHGREIPEAQQPLPEPPVVITLAPEVAGDLRRLLEYLSGVSLWPEFPAARLQAIRDAVVASDNHGREATR